MPIAPHNPANRFAHCSASTYDPITVCDAMFSRSDIRLTVSQSGHSVADPGNQSRLDSLWYELEAFVAN